MAGQPIADLGAQQQPRPTEASQPSPASALATEIKTLVEQGHRDEARERFGALVALLQRRALRIAFQYLREAADADEAVQDAFVKVFLHIEQYRSDLRFEVWFTRILVNAALDRLKARGRQQRWISHSTDEENGHPVEQVPSAEASHERRLLAKERWAQVTDAVAALPERQRLVFTLCHLDEQTPAEISAATGMSQATVRVHLFRALRKLRGVLGGGYEPTRHHRTD
jgi:RNA polymerase sigma-70 factor (ECF subfamily)